MSNHNPTLRLSRLEKERWFISEISACAPPNGFRSEYELSECLREARRNFKSKFGRDVSGSFMKVIARIVGQQRDSTEKTKLKKSFMFKSMDENSALRESKSQMKLMMRKHFGDSLATIMFDEMWDEYHRKRSHPEATRNTDTYGQIAIFDS